MYCSSWGLRGTGTPGCVPKNARVASVYARVRFFPSFQRSQRQALATDFRGRDLEECSGTRRSIETRFIAS